MNYHFDDNLYNGDYYTGKIAQIYYDGLRVPTNKQTYLHIDQLLHKINFFVHIVHVLAVKQVGIWVWYNSGQKILIMLSVCDVLREGELTNITKCHCVRYMILLIIVLTLRCTGSTYIFC